MGLFEKALELKDEVFGEKIGWLEPKDISPHINSWFVGLFICLVGVFTANSLFHSILYGVLFVVLNWSFYRSVVKL